MKLDNNTKYKLITNALIFALGFIIALLLFKSCHNTPEQQNTVIKQIKHTRDTIWAKDTIYSFKNIKVKVPIKVTDTIYKSLPVDSTICKTVYLYEDSLVDTNLVIYYKDYVQGIMRDKSLKYKLKVPLKIIDSVNIKETIIIKPKFNISVGTMASVNMISPGIKFRVNRHEFGINYNIVTENPAEGILVTWKYILFEK